MRHAPRHSAASPHALSRRQFTLGLGLAGATMLLPRAHSADAANPIIPRPKVNQLGYFPGSSKFFSYSVSQQSQPQAFTIENAAGSAIFHGELGKTVFDERAAAGEFVRRGDFAALRDPGTYRVRVGDALSQPFTIGARVYDPLLRAAARCFWIIRANVAIDDPVTGIAHPLSHPGDAALPAPSGHIRDVSGGWYNAGDFGKWVHMEAISSSAMMWAYELRPDALRSFDLQLGERDRTLPDLLALAKWGLSFMLRMQNPDGSVLHKVDSEPNFWLGPIEKDPYTRRIRPGGSIDAGVFVGAMLQAARTFRKFDPPFALRCENAALSAWKWLEANPRVLQADPYYVDHESWEEGLWALAEIARTTGDSALQDRVITELDRRPLVPLTWSQPHIMGYFSLCLGEKVRANVKQRARQKLLDLAQSMTQVSAANGYGVSLAPTEYVWGSVENVLYKSGALFFAAEISGDHSFAEAARRQLDYVLGTNSLDHSFVAGFGTRSSIGAHHWTNWSLHKIMPGWVSGGPNHYTNGADPQLIELIRRGTPPAKCFVDVPPPHTSWASNEGTTSENAGLVFAATMASM